MLDFLRIGCAVPAVRLGDPMENARRTVEYMEKAEAAGCDLLVFPELSLTGYTCADLFQQESLLAGAGEALKNVTEKSRSYPDLTVCLGLPLLLQGQLYNVAAALNHGRILGLTTKTFLPNYGEFYEMRQFREGPETARDIFFDGEKVPFGPQILFTASCMEQLVVSAEICEDVWSPIPPSIEAAREGATIIVNCPASDETIGNAAYRRNLIEG